MPVTSLFICPFKPIAAEREFSGHQIRIPSISKTIASMNWPAPFVVHKISPHILNRMILNVILESAAESEFNWRFITCAMHVFFLSCLIVWYWHFAVRNRRKCNYVARNEVEKSFWVNRNLHSAFCKALPIHFMLLHFPPELRFFAIIQLDECMFMCVRSNILANGLQAIGFGLCSISSTIIQAINRKINWNPGEFGRNGIYMCFSFRVFVVAVDGQAFVYMRFLLVYYLCVWYMVNSTLIEKLNEQC